MDGDDDPLYSSSPSSPLDRKEHVSPSCTDTTYSGGTVPLFPISSLFRPTDFWDIVMFCQRIQMSIELLPPNIY